MYGYLKRYPQKAIWISHRRTQGHDSQYGLTKYYPIANIFKKLKKKQL